MIPKSEIWNENTRPKREKKLETQILINVLQQLQLYNEINDSTNHKVISLKVICFILKRTRKTINKWTQNDSDSEWTWLGC